MCVCVCVLFVYPSQVFEVVLYWRGRRGGGVYASLFMWVCIVKIITVRYTSGDDVGETRLKNDSKFIVT